MKASEGMRVLATSSDGKQQSVGTVWIVRDHGDHQHITIYGDDGVVTNCGDEHIVATTIPEPAPRTDPKFHVGDDVVVDFHDSDSLEEVSAAGTITRVGYHGEQPSYLVEAEDGGRKFVVVEDEVRLQTGRMLRGILRAPRRPAPQPDTIAPYATRWHRERMIDSPYTIGTIVSLRINGVDGEIPMQVWDFNFGGVLIGVDMREGSALLAGDAFNATVTGLWVEPLPQFDKAAKFREGDNVSFHFRDTRGVGMIVGIVVAEQIAYMIDAGPDAPGLVFAVERDIDGYTQAQPHLNDPEPPAMKSMEELLEALLKPDDNKLREAARDAGVRDVPLGRDAGLEARVAALEADAAHRREYYERCRNIGADYESRLESIEEELGFDPVVLPSEDDEDGPLKVTFTVYREDLDDGDTHWRVTAESDRPQDHDELRAIAHAIARQIGDPSPYEDREVPGTLRREA